jgi:CDP-6-deoxy-D-xylo-4-hexulose-3-dehydrase
MGESVRRFEREFADWIGAPYAAMVNSGSSANLLMVDSLLRRSKGKPPLKKGDEVIVPALAWPTTVWPLVQLGLVPVYVDVEPMTLAIDLRSAQRALSPKTKCMFLIHVLGQAADMKAIADFCAVHGITLIEDSCESLGAHFGGRHVGTFGVSGSYSCFFSHHISTIEGGVITTGDAEIYEDLKSLRAHGWVRDRGDMGEWIARYPELDPRFMFIIPGYNVRPTEIAAAIGSVQLRRLDQMLAAREKLALDVLGWSRKSVPWLTLIGSEHLTDLSLSRRERRHSWMTLPFSLHDDAPVSLSKVKETFERIGVETRPIIAGNLARHPANQYAEHRKDESLARCDALLSRGFMIGCHPVLDSAARAVLEEAFFQLGRL